MVVVLSLDYRWEDDTLMHVRGAQFRTLANRYSRTEGTVSY